MYIPVDFLIYAVCLTICSITSYYLGRNQGIVNAVQYFIDTGVIEAEEADDEDEW